MAYRCTDCRQKIIGEWYMVRDEVWHSSRVPQRYLLCIGCLEARLGRRLAPRDFTDCPANTSDEFHRTPRLINRLGMAQRS